MYIHAFYKEINSIEKSFISYTMKYLFDEYNELYIKNRLNLNTVNTVSRDEVCYISSSKMEKQNFMCKEF